MYFTSGQNRAFERLMQEKPGFNHYDGGGADAPEDWDYTLKGLSLINRESIDAIRTAVWELEKAGYIRREQGRDPKGKMADMVYTIYEQPVLENPVLENPTSADPVLENPTSDNPSSGNPTQLNKDIQTT